MPPPTMAISLLRVVPASMNAVLSHVSGLESSAAPRDVRARAQNPARQIQNGCEKRTELVDSGASRNILLRCVDEFIL